MLALRGAPIRSLLLVGLPVLACGSLGTEPSPPTRPLIASLSLDFVVNHGQESVRVWFTQAPPRGPGEIPAGRSVVTLRTSSGDEEEKLLFSFVCLDREGTPYVCNSFVVGLQEGTSESDLIPLLRPMAGRLTHLLFKGSMAGVFVTEGNVFDAMRQARQWPGARWVVLNKLATVQDIGLPANEIAATSGDEPARGVLWVPVLASGPPVPFDGVVQAQPGDTLTVTYDGGGPQLVQAQIVVE
jgi:hypothetical protein